MTTHNKQNDRVPWLRHLRLRHPVAWMAAVVLAVWAWPALPACRADERNAIVTSNDAAMRKLGLPVDHWPDVFANWLAASGLLSEHDHYNRAAGELEE